MAYDAKTGTFSWVWCLVYFFIKKLLNSHDKSKYAHLPGGVQGAKIATVNLSAGSRRWGLVSVCAVVVSRWEKLLGAEEQIHEALCRRRPSPSHASFEPDALMPSTSCT